MTRKQRDPEFAPASHTASYTRLNVDVHVCILPSPPLQTFCSAVFVYQFIMEHDQVTISLYLHVHGCRPQYTVSSWWVSVGEEDCAKWQRSKVSVTRVSCIQAHDYSTAGSMWKSPPLPQSRDGRYPAGCAQCRVSLRELRRISDMGS